MTTRQQIHRAHGRWRELWRRLGAPPPPDESFDQLVAAYGDTRRHYHTFDHVLDCLEVLDRFSQLATEPEEIEIALWFHDAVYDTSGGDNEEASASWAVRVMAEAGIGDDPTGRVRRMILATCHQTPPETRDEALMLDIDLSILGREWTRFAAYEDQIRQEFDWVADDAFRSGRAAVLRTFLDRPRIFQTSELRAVYEQRARENLESVLRRCPTTRGNH